MEQLNESRFDLIKEMLTQGEQSPVRHSHSSGFYLPPQNYGSYMQQTYMQPVHVAGAYPSHMATTAPAAFYPPPA